MYINEMFAFSSATVIGWNAAVESGLVCNWTEAIEFTDFNCTCNDSNAILGRAQLGTNSCFLIQIFQFK